MAKATIHGEALVHRILLSGYYGFGNLGDEAILAAFAQEFASQVDLVVLSADPAQTERAFGVRAIGRTDLSAIRHELRGASLFVSGGGGLMQDVTGALSVPYYGGLLKLAQWHGVPTMVFGQGVGPLQHWPSRWMVGAAFKRCRRITVRDEESFRLLTGLGISSERLQLTADPVLCLAGAPSGEIDEIVKRCGLEPQRPFIGVAIRPWASWYELQFKSLSTALTQLSLASGAQLLLLPFQRPGDERITEELRDCLTYRPEDRHGNLSVLRETLSPSEMMGLIGRASLMVGMRLHSLIMAAASGVPSVGLVYDPKVQHLCSQWGFPFMPSIESLGDAQAFDTMLQGAWQTRNEEAKRIQASGITWKQKARLNFEAIYQILGMERPDRAIEPSETGV